MAATVQQHRATNASNTANRTNNTATKNPNPQLKRLVYSKYRELLGSYNDQANAYIDTLPSYMVHKDTGFNLEMKNNNDFVNSNTQNSHAINNNQNEMYGAGQRMPSQQTYEAPACVQNAMMTKDKKPFTYTPGGIDLSQIKSERMAKRLARNAQAEGATGIQQQNRPTQPQSPSGTSPNGTAAAAMGAAAMGMPFQVLPPPPPPAPASGKNFNGGSTPAPPPPPPSSSNFSKTGTLAPPSNGNDAVGRGSTPNSPSMPRKSPTPQRFEPPPMGFRPEIKIPPNPMASLRKVPPPVEKNNFWKDEYVKERSKSPMVDIPNTVTVDTNNYNSRQNDSVNSGSSTSPQTTNANYNGTAILNNDNIDGFKKPMPTTTTNNVIQQNQTNNNFTNHQQTHTPPTPFNSQQSPLKPLQHAPQYGGSQTPLTPLQQNQINQQSPLQQQHSPKPEFRSVAAPTSPAVNVYTRQTDSPRTLENATPPRATESPFKFAQQQQPQQQQYQQQRAPPAVSPLAQQSAPSSASSGASVSPNNNLPGQTVPWRTQRAQAQQQPSAVAQSHPQPIYNNVQQQQPRTPDFNTQQSAYQGPKPTNIGSLYIAPLAPPPEPQAQHIVRQQMQQHQQQQQRDSPMRQMVPQQQQQPNQQLRWMSTQPVTKEHPAWVRPEENGNVVPSSLNRIKSPPPSAPTAQAQQSQQLQHNYQTLSQGNGFAPQNSPQNFGAQPINTTGLRLQINTPVNQSNNQTGPKERIIPIQLEQTPTYTSAQPSFNQTHQPTAGSIPPAPGYVMRTPNQFVDQGYNNFGQQQQPPQPQRIMSPTLQQLNAPRMVQQTQNNIAPANKTHIIPITIENNEALRGPISKTPIVIQNDQRTPPVQSKSFRILQKITDTIDDSNNDDQANQQQQQQPIEPQLQRPTFARQMSAQQARHSPTVEQMKRMQIGHEQGNYSAPATPSAIKYNNQQQQRSFYDNNSQQYIPPSEQQAPEPKKYTGSAIPSRSFKILQAMTQPENAEKPEICQKNNEMNEIESKPESNRHSSCSCNSSGNEPPSSSSSTSLNSELNFSSSPSPSLMQYPPYQYPYVYPWYPPPTHFMSTNQNVENYAANNWPYPYVMPSNITSTPAAGEHATRYPPYAYYYPYFPVPSPLHVTPPNQNSNPNAQSTEYDFQNICMPPPPPYLAYPYPVVPSYSQSSGSSRASSVLPDIIITPSTDDMPSKVIMQHHIKVEKERSKRASSLKLEDVTAVKMKPLTKKDSAVDIQTHQLETRSKCIQNNLNTKFQTKKPYEKNFNQKSPENNNSPVQVNLTNTKLENGSHSQTDTDTDTETSDSEITPKLTDSKEPNALKSIKSVNNIQIYNEQARQQQIDSDFSCVSETDGDDETTADGESEIFDAEDEEEEQEENFELIEESLEQEGNFICEEYLIDDNLSVIYEEESEMEKSSLVAKTTATADDKSNLSEELPLKINNNEKLYNSDDEKDDSTSVTVRLPLKFSFSSTKNAENVTTLEVGKSQIQENITNPALNEKRNTFSVASIKSDAEDEDDDVSSESDGCDVSVTIPLTHSSKSSLVDEQVNNKPANKLYPIDDISVTEEETKSSQEDVSVSLSLNMRNKFSTETNNGNITNNIAEINDATPTEQVEELNEAPEEMDFFATLRATKMQAQKIKEQSANYWGKMADDKFRCQQEIEQTHSEQQQVLKEETQKRARTLEDNKETKKSKVILKKKCSKPKTETETGNEAKKQETKAKKPKESKAENSNCKKHKIECESKAKINNFEANKSKTLEKYSFWDQEDKIKKQEALKPKKVLETKEDHTPKVSLQQPKELQKTQNLKMKETVEVTNKFLIDNADTNSHSEASEATQSIAHETEEIVDIWADREEDLPPIKPIKSKLHTLETARNSFWSSVYETEKQAEKERMSLQPPERITKVAFNLNALRSVIKAVAQPQAASVSYEPEYINHQDEDAKDVDFWQEIEQPRESITPQPHIAKAFNWEAETTANESVLSHTFGEQETSFYNDDNNTDDAANDKTTTYEQFDPLKYPEEPREVDTDEEIDFWAEIEAKRQAEEDDVTFHKSASFWASRERENSVDETPYKPVLPKAFHAKLPDEPPTEDINIWQTLEAHKGEEPLIIDPVVEEEKALALEYDQMMQVESIEEQHNDDAVSVHEPVTASVWCPQTQINPQVEEKQQISQDIRNSSQNNSIIDLDELEVKRNNYRKAMVFFTTSIDENKEQMVDRYERSKSKSNRASYIEEETEQWDWDAVNEALQQEKPADIQETFVKEETPQATLCCKSLTEALPLPEIYATSTKKRLSNGLPDLEVQKFIDERKISVKDRISAFETGAVDQLDTDSRRNSIKKQSLSVESSTRQNSLSRNSSTQRSESEMDEDDSGVTDMNKQLSETDTESESFPELRKMSSYQRASTHSRLFKLLQDDPDVTDSQPNVDEFQFKPSRRRIVHNVSITRKQNSNALAEAETMSQRRERLSLPLRKNTSIDNDNPSTPNSPASPIMGPIANKSTAVSDKLVSELVQSLLLRSESTQFRKLPMEKLQAAAKKVLEEELESLDNNSLDATPATTPCDIRKEKTYTDYYNTWSDALGAEDIVPSKSFKALQDSRRSSWTARCPRVLSSKTINRDLARVTESPEIYMHNIRQSRETSIGKWKK